MHAARASSVPSDARLADSEVERVLAQRLVVGSDVDRHRQHAVGMDASGGGVESQLADLHSRADAITRRDGRFDQSQWRSASQQGSDARSYGNAHSVAAEVSETKDAAAISDHDDVHLVRAIVMARE